jgi:glyoxylase-like metal-dependent hydrolase (beta-lactamase superfamily II)
MRLTIHHLNCGTICPYSARLLNGEGNLFSPGYIVCHCLLIETDDGLVLVDTGLGTMDITTSKTLRREFKLLARPKLDLQETAVRHVSRLGFKTEDVRHIVLTHLDVDHAGGLPDFPKAQVHILGKEYEAALHPQTQSERFRYVKHHWQH